MDAEAEFLESRPPGSRNARRWKCASIRKPYRKRKVFFPPAATANAGSHSVSLDAPAQRPSYISS